MADNPERLTRFVIILVLAVTLITGAAFVVQRSANGSIDSFDECVAAGNPVAESYPEQCFAGGQSFTNPNQTDGELPDQVQ